MNKLNEMKDSHTLECEDVVICGTTVSVAVLQDSDPANKPHVCIPLNTLQRIIADADYEKTSFSDIKSAFIQSLRDNVHNMSEYVLTLDEELSFHRTVNILAKATTKPKSQDDSSDDTPKVVGKIDLPKQDVAY